MAEGDNVATNVGRMRSLTAFQHNILVILAEEARYGLAIKRELETFYDEEVNHGRLYPNLDDLVEMGLIRKSELDKRTNEYSLTDAGEQAILGRLEWVFSKLLANEGRRGTLMALIDAAD